MKGNIMPDETKTNPIGGPEPIDSTEGYAILNRIVTIVGVSAGGLLALACLLTPTRVRGATRSARLRWQERQNEIQAISASGSIMTNKPAAPEEDLSLDQPRE